MTTIGDSQPGSAASQAGAIVASVDRQMATGALWMVFARVIDRVIGLASIVILARLLMPSDFGLVAMATSIMGVLELLGTFSFDVALIQNSSATRSDYDTAWTFNVIFGAALAGALVAAAVPAAWFYDEPRLEIVIAWLALGTLIQGFENIGVVAFRKELRFDKEFTLIFAKRLITFAVTIPTAIALRNYWALVVGMIVGRFVSVWLTYLVHSYRPRFSLSARHALFHFSKWLVINNVLNFVGGRSADFLIGKISGARELGLFILSSEIATLPSTDLIAPINRAIYPGYALKAAEPGMLRRSYLEVTGLVALLAIPAGTGIAAVADLLVPLALGPQWIAAGPPLVLLCFYGILRAMTSNNHYVYLAMGRPRIATFLGTVHILMVLPAIAVGSLHWGALGAAGGHLLAQTLFTPISWITLRRALKVRLVDIASLVYRPIVAAAIMFAGVHLVASQLSSTADAGIELLIPLLVCVLAGAILYTAAVFVLWSLSSKPSGPESRALEMLYSQFSRYLRRSQ